MTGFFSTSTLTGSKKRISLIAHCGSCRLHNTCKSPKMKPTGKGLKKILIVNEAPGEEDDRRGTQLVGKEGQALRKILWRLGIDLDRDCWMTSAVACCPPKHLPPTDEQIIACAPTLFKYLGTIDPNVVILLGGASVQSVIGTLRNEKLDNRAAWMGWQIPYQELNTWICPTYHPSYFLRKQDSLIEKLMKDQLQKAIRKRAAKPWKNVPDYKSTVELIFRPREASSTLKEIQKKGGTIAFDYETNALKPEYEGAELVSCSVCWEGRKTIAYPLAGEAIEATKELLASPIKKIACNLKFEHRWTKYKLGVNIKNWIWDTMLAAHVLDHREGITSLKFQAFVLLGQKSYNDNIEPFLSSKSKKTRLNRINEIDTEDLLLYNGMDALLEYKVAMKQMKQMGIDPRA